MFHNINVKVYETILELLLIFLGCSRLVSSACPGICFCPPLSDNVFCSRKNLPFIPSGVSPDTVQLNMNENNFLTPILFRSNFSTYTKLEHLYISSCGIERIEVDTFADLTKLQWLDLSKNRLKVIEDYSFRGLTLEHLFLNDNPGMRISKNAFVGLRTMGLYIHNCAISQLSLEVIRPMNRTLKYLWLDGNKFESFQIDWLYVFRTLSHTRLAGNPLHCNCEVGWLFEFYKNNLKMFTGVDPPSCRTPSRLRAKNFNELSAEDFRCQLPVFKKVDAIFEEQVGKLNCVATGDPVPTIQWLKPGNGIETFKPKAKTDSNDNYGILYLSDPQATEDLVYKCVASNPAGNVTFSLNVVWPPKYSRDQFIINTPKPTPPPTLPPTKAILIPDPETLEKDKSKDKEKLDKISKSNNNEKSDILEKSDKQVSPGIEKPRKTENSKDDAYVINASKSGMSMKRETTIDGGFSLTDIIGAVVGTFLLTLLACIAIFHVVNRRYSHSLMYKSQNGLQEKQTNNRIIVDARTEHMKMLQNNI